MCYYCNHLIPWLGFYQWTPLSTARHYGCCPHYEAAIIEWYSSLGEGKWRENRHGERKTRLITALRDIWQFHPSPQLEALTDEVATVVYSQLAIRHDARRQARRLRSGITGDNSTQFDLALKY